MNVLLVTGLISTLLMSTYCFDASHHRHRHSRSHPQDDFERIMNRLDAQSTLKDPETTPKPPHKDIFDDFTESITSSNSDPGNSLWDDGDSGDASTRSPLGQKWWDDIVKGENVDKEKHREEVEDAVDDADEQAEDEEEGFDDQQEQSDSFRSWSARSGESHSKWKWKNMGSPKSVSNLFQAYRSGSLKSDAGEKEAAVKTEFFHYSKLMAKETLCRWPKPKVIRVVDSYGSSNTLYVPACTVLHRCGDDTGCCSGDQQCGPKTVNKVELSFYTAFIVGSPNLQRSRHGIVKLPFYNHTECECVDRTDMMPRDGSPNSDIRNERNSEPECKCPTEYTERRFANGSCTCDCFDRQRDCIKYKRGKEYFNHEDRKCIEMGTCAQPSCDFGAYIRSYGRCPRKHEKIRSTWARSLQ